MPYRSDFDWERSSFIFPCPANFDSYRLGGEWYRRPTKPEEEGGWRARRSTFLVMTLYLGLVGCDFFRLRQEHPDRNLSLRRILAHLFREHFWFFSFWFTAAGGFVVAVTVEHVGGDISLNLIEGGI